MCKSFGLYWLTDASNTHQYHMGYPTAKIEAIWNTLYMKTRAVLLPGNRAKPCKFRYVKSVRNFTWKLCYRKDDRAMHPIRGWPENFRGSLTDYAHGYYSQNFSLAFVPIHPVNVSTKLEVLSSWDNRGYPKNFGSPWIHSRSLFSKFLWAFIRIGPVNVLAKFEVRSFTCSSDKRG